MCGWNRVGARLRYATHSAGSHTSSPQHAIQGERPLGTDPLLVTLTNFGDQGVILPLTVITAAVLVVIGWYRGALAWVGVVVAVLALVGAGKVLTSACLLGWPSEWDFRSPSGHTASAGIVYGSLLGLLVPWGRPQILAAVSATVFAVTIGASRLLLDQHTISDVLVGGAVGILGAMALVHLAGPRPTTVKHRCLIILAVPLGLALFHGSHVHAEPWIGALARTLSPLSQCATPFGQH